MQQQNLLLLLTPQEVSKYLVIPIHKIYNLINDGYLVGFKIGTDWRIRRDSVEKLFGPISKDFFDSLKKN